MLWYNDSAGKMDDGKDANTGLVQRRRLLSATKSVDMIGHLHCDMFNQEKLLINGIEVRVRLVRSRDSFCLMNPTGCYFVHIYEDNLLVRRVKISSDILLAHAQYFQRQLPNILSRGLRLKL